MYQIDITAYPRAESYSLIDSVCGKKEEFDCIFRVIDYNFPMILDCMIFIAFSTAELVMGTEPQVGILRDAIPVIRKILVPQASSDRP